MPFARFVQMLRVIEQERGHEQAWQSYFQGAGKKDESFEKFARRVGAEARTPPPASARDRDKAVTIAGVKRKLGRLYRPPIKA